MPKCAVKKCKNDTRNVQKKDGISYFSFPRNALRCSKWISIIARDRKEEFYKPYKGSVVCSKHFDPSNIYSTTKGFRRLNKNAIPTFNMSDNDCHEKAILIQDAEANEESIHSSHLSSHATQDPFPCGESSSQEVVIRMKDNNDSLDQDTEANKGSFPLSHPVSLATPVSTSYSGESRSKKDLTIEKNEKSPTSSLSIGSILDTPKKTVLKRRLNICEIIIQKKNKQINRLQKQNKRLLKKNISLKKAILILQKRKGIDVSLFTELSDNIEVTETFNALYLKNIKKKKRSFAKYPPGVRKFALTFHFYSPSAYKYVRRLYNTCLPHPNTLSNWYRSINAEPGFTAESFDRLKDKAKNSNKEIIGALVADEMSIRQQKIWTGKKYEGLVDMGVGTEDSTLVASQVYVIMLVAINDSFKLPLGYFLITSLTAEVKANLLIIALRKCHQANVKIVSITFDGCKTNIATMKLLGCNLDNKQSIKTNFKHPCADYNVVVFLDACHMVKLMRNVFESKKIIKNGKNEAVKWSYVTKLHKLQEEQQLHLANKLTHRHIAFKNQIMKVKLATQLLSRSVAKALQFCDINLDLPEFKGSSATSQFIMTINNVFDILNTRNLRDYGLKKPLSVSNSVEIMAVIEEAKQYLTSLNINIRRKRTIKTNKHSKVVFSTENVLLLDTQSHTGVLGLIVCLDSLRYLYTNLVETGVMDFLLSYKTSQDHIELFFGNIRSQGGYNNNPNSRQVKSAYKKLLTHMELSSKFSGNSIPLEDIPILRGESNLMTLNHTTSGYRKEIEAEKESEDETDNRSNISDDWDEIMSNCDILSSELDTSTSITTSSYIDQIVGYISGNVVRQIIKKIKCDICVKALLAQEKLHFHKFIDIRNMGGLFYSSNDVFLLCKKTEMMIRHNQCTDKVLKDSKILAAVLKSFVDSNIFEKIVDHSLYYCNLSYNHRTILMKTIVQHYINIRFHYIAKKETDKIKQNSKRQLYNKLTLFRGN